MANMNYNLRHLRAFYEVAQCGTISEASGRIFLSQPAITQAISKLEKSMNVLLFSRKSNGMYLTEPGEFFYIRIGRALTYLKIGAQKAIKANLTNSERGFVKFDKLMTNSQLRALIAVSETGNFTWAARKYGVSRPSIHRSINDLESISGVAMFKKSAQGFEQTPSGEVLEKYSRLALSELNLGISEVQVWLGHDSTEIVIGTMPLARSFVLPEVITKITEDKENVKIKVVDGPYKDLLHGLRFGQHDFLFGALRFPTPVDDVVQEELFTDELVIAARIGHPLCRKKNVTVIDLNSFPWVIPGSNIPTRIQFDDFFRDALGKTPDKIVETSSLILMLGLLQRSNRLTMISSHQIQQEICEGVLQPVNFRLGLISRPIGITTRKDWHSTATHNLFLDLLRKTVS